MIFNLDNFSNSELGHWLKQLKEEPLRDAERERVTAELIGQIQTNWLRVTRTTLRRFTFKDNEDERTKHGGRHDGTGGTEATRRTTRSVGGL